MGSVLVCRHQPIILGTYDKYTSVVGRSNPVYNKNIIDSHNILYNTRRHFVG